MATNQKRRDSASEYPAGDQTTPFVASAGMASPTAQGGEVEMTIDLVDLFYRIIGSWKLIACLAVGLALLAGLFTAFFITPTYEATAIIYVLSNSDSAINMSDLQLGSELTQDYIKVFTLWEVHEQVRSNLGLDYEYSEMEEMLTVTNDSDTRMLDITITSTSAQEAADMANEYAEVASAYIAQTMNTDQPNIMSVALVPSNPVGPNLTRNILIAFVLGAFFGVCYVVIRMLMDDKYKTAEDIRKYTGLATLAVVPVEGSDRDERRRKV